MAQGGKGALFNCGFEGAGAPTRAAPFVYRRASYRDRCSCIWSKYPGCASLDTLRQFGCALEEQLPSRRHGWPTIRIQWSVRRHGANDDVLSLKAVSPDHAWIVSDLHLSVGGAVKRGLGARANRRCVRYLRRLSCIGSFRAVGS